MRVYLDSVLVLNFCVNYLLLRGVALLGASAAGRGRLALSALFGAVYAVAVWLPGCGWLSLLPGKLIFAAAMLLLAFGLRPSTLRLGAVFFGLSLALGGAIYAVMLLQGKPLRVFRQSLLYPVSFATVSLTAAAIFAACRLLLPRLSHAPNSLLPVTIRLNGRRVRITALRDSGNTLADPISGAQVLTAEWSVARRLLPDQTLCAADFSAPAVLALRLRSYAPRLIPYRAVGVASGLLLALPCEITVGKQTKSGLVAFSPTPVSDGGAYEALTGGTLYV